MTAPKNQTDLASQIGISKAQVSALAKRGMPVDDVDAAKTWRMENIDPARKKGQRYDQYRQPDQPPQNGGGGGETFDQARTREKIAAANLAEMEAAALRGTYLVKADFERYLYNAGRMLRDTLTNCARRVSAEVAGMTTAEECEAVIDREHRAALASFSQNLRQTLKIEVENSPLNAPNVGDNVPTGLR